MNKRAKIDRIEQYLRGELSELDRTVLEEAMEQDPELKALYDFHRDVHDAVSNPKIDAFEQAVKKADVRYHAPPAPPRLVRTTGHRWWAAAALVILALSWAIFATWEEGQSPTLASLYQPYPTTTVVRGEAVLGLSDATLMALSHYEQGQFAQAIPYWWQSLAQDPTQAMPRLLYSICLIELDSLPQAVTQLAALTQDDSHTLQGPAWWYLAVAQDRLQLAGPAKQSLLHLSSLPEGQWSTQAKALLE
ncbi:MAG: tetratricopeptide repeat protein [Bacteroidota bacterium]